MNSNKFKIVVRYIFAIYLFAFALNTYASTNEHVINLAGSWQVCLDSTDVGVKENWSNKQFSQSMLLPGTTDVAGLGLPNLLKPELQKPQVLFLTRKHKFIGPVWYARELTIPKGWDKKTVIIKLERVLWETQLWIDGKRVPIKQESLIAPHYFDVTGLMSPGKHRIVFRIDNRKKYDISVPGANSPLGLAHAYTDDTQTIWNGIIGEMTCSAYDRVRITDFQLYPDPVNKCTKIKLVLEKNDLKTFRGDISFQLKSVNEDIVFPSKKIKLKFDERVTVIEETLEMGEHMKLWSEISPYMYNATASVSGKGVKASESRNFGMRKLTNKNSALQVNGSNIFLRGTLECCIFPQTGHPPMNHADWRKVFTTAREWGLNHIRFHSWCPPRYAFDVADSLGFYVQVELPLWSLKVNQDTATNRFLYQEADRIIKEYGNHPSFCFWSIGNELQADFRYLNGFVDRLKQKDPRHLYTNTSYTFEKGHGTWPEPNDDYYISQFTEKGWVRGQGVFGSEPPMFNKDYSAATKGLQVPLVSHEIGQYSVYPSMNEIGKYKGVLDPLNFKAVKADLEKKGLIERADDYTLASGKLAALLYKEEIERALKTQNISGFQLLDLHDFPGQGTALVGLLDAFWESKGVISPEKFREFCSVIVPLVRFGKPIYKSNEFLKATVEIANYSGANLNAVTEWQLVDSKGSILQRGELAEKILSNGANTLVGNFEYGFSGITKAEQITLIVSVRGTNFRNSWKLWVYPADMVIETGKVIYTRSIIEAEKALQKGMSVLFNPDWRKLKGIEGKFLPVFWSPVHFPKQAATMGVLCNPNHKALSDFPTEMHADWQWWDLTTNSKTLLLDSISTVSPIVEMVDNWMNNRRLALIFEAKCGNGKLIYSTIDLQNSIDERPQAKQLLYSLLRYMNTNSFDPRKSVSINELKKFEAETYSDKKEKAEDIY